MIEVPVYNLKGEEIEKISLNPKIFDVGFRPDVINQVILAMRANRRVPSAHTKFRSEVRGGGKKPWRQKGTGRARHGSIRSPLWVGGGVTFGPRKEKQYAQKINKKTKRLALFSALSQKLRDKEIKFVDAFSFEKPKTKEVFLALSNLLEIDKKKKKVDLLVVLTKFSEGVLKSVRNLPKTKAILADSLNVEDLMIYKNVLMEKGAVEIIEKTYLK